jgi:hypothetical protein
MMGVRFNRSMRPYSAGDTAWLPDDVAKKLIADGEADQYRFPKSPHGSDPVKQRVTKEGTTK